MASGFQWEDKNHLKVHLMPGFIQSNRPRIPALTTTETLKIDVHERTHRFEKGKGQCYFS